MTFTRARKTAHRGAHLCAGVVVSAVLVLLWCFPPEHAVPSWLPPELALGLTFGLRLGLTCGAFFLFHTALSDFTETWTFETDGIVLESRTLFGQGRRAWPAGDVSVRLQPNATHTRFHMSVRVGKGEWMLVFSFDDRQQAARAATRIEAMVGGGA